MFTLDTTPQWTEDGAIGETGPPAPLRVVSDYVREHVTAQTQGSFSSSQSVFLKFRNSFAIIISIVVFFICRPQYGGEDCTGESDQMDTCKSTVNLHFKLPLFYCCPNFV